MTSTVLITAIFSVLGIMAGAVLQYFFTRHLDRQKHHRDMRTTAYMDYLRCAAERANLGKQRQSSEGREISAKLADAKCRICLYGSSSVVEAFARFEQLGSAMNTSEQRAAFIDMVTIMRRDSTDDHQIKSSDFETVLLGAPAE